MSLGRRLRSIALLGAAAATLAGCASALDVRYPEGDARPALLASVAPRRVAIAPVVDRRLQQARVGDDPISHDPTVSLKSSVASSSDGNTVSFPISRASTWSIDTPARMSAPCVFFAVDAVSHDAGASA